MLTQEWHISHWISHIINHEVITCRFPCSWFEVGWCCLCEGLELSILLVCCCCCCVFFGGGGGGGRHWEAFLIPLSFLEHNRKSWNNLNNIVRSGATIILVPLGNDTINCFQHVESQTSPEIFQIFPAIYKPASQSCGSAAAKSETFWWATGQSNLAHKLLKFVYLY